MAINYYSVPKIGTGVKGDGFRPKYIWDMVGPDGLVINKISMALGKEPWMLVKADTDTTQDNFIASQPDGFRIPQPLTNTIATSGTLNGARNALETMNLPGGWITVNNTFLEVMRAVAWIAQFLQILDGMGITKVFNGGTNLSSSFNSLPQATRTAFQTAATQMNLDTSGFTGTTSLRVIFTSFINQFILRPISIEN